jgi:hypothetical protein
VDAEGFGAVFWNRSAIPLGRTKASEGRIHLSQRRWRRVRDEAFPLFPKQAATVPTVIVRFHKAVVFAVIALFVVAVSVTLGVLIVNRVLVFLVEDVGEDHSELVYTRFRDSPKLTAGAGPVTLMAFFFPGAEVTETIDISRYGGAQEPKGQLSVWRFRTRESLAKVADWYSQKLGQNFTRTKGWPEPGQNNQGRWMSGVNKSADPDAFVFRQSLNQRVRGVLLQTPPEEHTTQITLYDYQQ